MDNTDQLFLRRGEPVTIFTASRTIYNGILIDCIDGFITVKLTAVPIPFIVNTAGGIVIPPAFLFMVNQEIRINIQQIESIA